MGQKVSGFVKDVAKTVAKAGTSFVLGKIPIVGNALANKINSMYKKGGVVVGLADGGVVSDKPKMVINTPAQLISLVKKVPEIASKYGLSEQVIKDAVKEAKQGEAVVAKRKGGKMKKGLKGESTVMLRQGGGGNGVPAFARGGQVQSVF